ncbi:hypothetical protein MRB53_010200 [Persea americana]|uniref:Uncharacterized protein n=1 Tax=Persea americana TaxID=3435 RepID=A0ACC2LRA0_PERAE|nr:hypothetical protein MRB53_010200 [Persea americana]
MCFKRLCGKERLARASMSFKTKTRASGSSFVTVGGSVKLDAGCLGLKLVLRTVLIHFTMKPCSRRLCEDTGSKGRFTNSAAERSALGSSEDLFSFKTTLGEIRA